MKDKTFPRRNVLRAALAAGCGMWMPVVLAADDAGKKTPSTSPAAAAATKKVPQASVQYQARPKGEQKCSLCMHFIAESNTCKLVEGQVSPEGWCSLWARKA